ncbi:MAG: hypothetical protein U0522_00490 [Candidatus Paceibacterota bacterium]
MKENDLKIGRKVEVTSLSNTQDWGIDDQYLAGRKLGAVGTAHKAAFGRCAGLWYIRDNDGRLSVYHADELSIPRAELELELAEAKNAIEELIANVDRATNEVLYLTTALHHLSNLRKGWWPFVAKHRIDDIFKVLKEARRLFEERLEKSREKPQ